MPPRFFFTCSSTAPSAAASCTAPLTTMPVVRGISPCVTNRRIDPCFSLAAHFIDESDISTPAAGGSKSAGVGNARASEREMVRLICASAENRVADGRIVQVYQELRDTRREFVP